jgi:two-component system, chemotaxis family, chemotaxis protein CheY
MVLLKVKATMASCVLIDENVAERSRIAALLNQLGISAHGISDVEEGIRYCHAQSPDVVLLDASALPRAKEFLRLVRHQSRLTGRPVVILYAHEADAAAMGDSILNGASEYLMLPFDLDLLRFKLMQAGVLVAEAA